jgi:hypothetical protein
MMIHRFSPFISALADLSETAAGAQLVHQVTLVPA